MKIETSESQWPNTIKPPLEGETEHLTRQVEGLKLEIIKLKSLINHLTIDLYNVP